MRDPAVIVAVIVLAALLGTPLLAYVGRREQKETVTHQRKDEQ